MRRPRGLASKFWAGLLCVVAFSFPAAASMTSAGAATGDVLEFPIPTASSLPQGVAAGPDGGLWFAEKSGNRIGRAAPDGTVTEFPLPTPSASPFWVAAGPDGAMWFTETGAVAVGRIAMDGAITEFRLPAGASGPYGIAAGPDGAMWFVERNANRVGRIAMDGTVTRFPIPTASSAPWGIATGTDGAMWFTEQSGNKIGRIATDGSGSVTEFPLPYASRLPAGIAAGPDGAMWFTERQGNSVGRIATDGTGVIDEYYLPTAAANPVGIATGPDGAMWFTGSGGNSVSRITTDGTASITEFPVPTAGSAPYGVARGGDGKMWFTGSFGNTVGRVDVVVVPPDTTPPTITLVAPADGGAYVAGDVVVADYACLDDEGGSGMASCDPSSEAAETATLGGHTFTVTAMDKAGNAAFTSHSYSVFAGLGGDLAPLPATNVVRIAGPVKVWFDMGSDYGKGLFDQGYPASYQVDCADPSLVLGGAVPASAKVTHAPGTRYTYRWKPAKSWRGTCRALWLGFAPDGWAPVEFLARFG